MKRGCVIPWEAADAITLSTLKEQYAYLVEELRKHDEEGDWMHPEDVENSRQNLIPALEIIINYFGD
jgi:ribosomal protein S12 methylthiotransferase accessory factor YcaO